MGRVTYLSEADWSKSSSQALPSEMKDSLNQWRQRDKQRRMKKTLKQAPSLSRPLCGWQPGQEAGSIASTTHIWLVSPEISSRPSCCTGHSYSPRNHLPPAAGPLVVMVPGGEGLLCSRGSQTLGHGGPISASAGGRDRADRQGEVTRPSAPHGNKMLGSRPWVVQADNRVCSELLVASRERKHPPSFSTISYSKSDDSAFSPAMRLKSTSTQPKQDGFQTALASG